MAYNTWNKQKEVKPVPNWYPDYLKEENDRLVKQKQKENSKKNSSVDLQELESYFNSNKKNNKEGGKNMPNQANDNAVASNYTNNNLYNKQGFNARKYSAKERQQYHNENAKKGATFIDSKTGEPKLRSDFNRGYHKAQADRICYERGKTAEFHKENGTYRKA